MSNTLTNEAGEYRFEPVSFGDYLVFVGDFFTLIGPNSESPATPFNGTTVELSSDHPEAEVQFEICKKPTVKESSAKY
jgi:hypothetical protein